MEFLAEQVADSQLLDVREAYEASICSLPNFRLLPFSKMNDWGRDVIPELNPEMRTVVLCHHGTRSNCVAQVNWAKLANTIDSSKFIHIGLEALIVRGLY